MCRNIDTHTKVHIHAQTAYMYLLLNMRKHKTEMNKTKPFYMIKSTKNMRMLKSLFPSLMRVHTHTISETSYHTQPVQMLIPSPPPPHTHPQNPTVLKMTKNDQPIDQIASSNKRQLQVQLKLPSCIPANKQLLPFRIHSFCTVASL